MDPHQDHSHGCAGALQASRAARRRVLGLGSAWLALGSLGALAACTRTDPERELRDTIDAMAAAIERHEVGDFLAYLADDFTRESGGFDKREVRRVLAVTLLRNEKIHLRVVTTEMQIEGERARVHLRVAATGGAGLLPERGQVWEFDSAWRREKGSWRVFNAEWRAGL